MELPPWYKTCIAEAKPSTPEADAKLIARYKAGDQSAGDKLVRNTLGAVAKIANKYKNYCSHDTLVAAGEEGILKAINKFNPKFKKTFFIYASMWIHAYMLRACKLNGSVVTRNVSGGHNNSGPKYIEQKDISLDTSAAENEDGEIATPIRWLADGRRQAG